MAVIPDLVFQSMLAKGLTNLRENPALLDQIFNNLSIAKREGLKQVFLENSIEISLNFPKKEIAYPSISITLMNEVERMAFLNDHMETDYDITPEEMTYDSSSLDEETALTGDDVEGQPSKIFDSNSPFREKGSFYNQAYSIKVFTGNPEFTIYLYYLVKLIIEIYRQDLEKRGIIGVVISGSDLAPIPTDESDIVYVRALNISCQVFFSWFTDLSDSLISEINGTFEDGYDGATVLISGSTTV